MSWPYAPDNAAWFCSRCEVFGMGSGPCWSCSRTDELCEVSAAYLSGCDGIRLMQLGVSLSRGRTGS